MAFGHDLWDGNWIYGIFVRVWEMWGDEILDFVSTVEVVKY